jgi:hypothetical protein
MAPPDPPDVTDQHLDQGEGGEDDDQRRVKAGEEDFD